MERVIKKAAAVFVALGLVLGAFAPYAFCEPVCCCHSGEPAASEAQDYAVIEPDGNCCCDTVSDYRGESEAAAVTATGESHSIDGLTRGPAGRNALCCAGVPGAPHAGNFSACNSPPIYKLVSSYLC